MIYVYLKDGGCVSIENPKSYTAKDIFDAVNNSTVGLRIYNFVFICDNISHIEVTKCN